MTTERVSHEPPINDPDRRWIDYCLRCGVKYRHEEGTYRLCDACMPLWVASEDHGKDNTAQMHYERGAVPPFKKWLDENPS